MLSDYISPCEIKFNLESTEREEAFSELLELMISRSPQLDTKENRKEIFNSLVEREGKMSTAVFPMVAVPHATCTCVKKTHIVLGISRSGIEFEPVEAESKINPFVNVIFQIVFEKENTDEHLHVLRDILNVVSRPEFCENILKMKSAQEIFNLIVELEN